MSGGQLWGFDSIGAIATKKPHGARAVQETFPSVFADTFAMMGSPQAYLPDQSGHHAPLEHGDSFQSSYHEEKKRDADYMANAKVHSTRMMNTRAFSSPNGYFGMPPAVLGQRIFANETGGVFSMNSARRDHASAPFHYSDAHGDNGPHGGALLGGVLRTAEGQGFGKARLMDRIAQLNAIEANAGNFSPDPRNKISAPTQSTTSFAAVQQQGESGLVTKLELFQLLQGINDSLLGSSSDGITSFTYKDTTRALTLMFRLVPTMEDYELADLQTTVSSILEKLKGAVADPEGTEAKTYEIAVTLEVLFDKIHDYLSEFALQTTQFGTRTDQEKLQISKTLVKTLKFASSLSGPRLEAESRYQPMMGETSTEAASLNRRHYEAESAARRSSTTSSSSSGGMDPQLRYARQDARSSARFSALAPTREDQRAEQINRQSGLGTFDVDERGAFGNNAGHFYPTGGRDVGYVEEGIDGPPQPPFTASPDRGPMVAQISRGVGAPVVREGAPDVRGVFDEDTQAFGVEVARGGPVDEREEFGRNAAMFFPAEGEGPRFTEALPTTREGFDALARRINALPAAQRPTKDGRPIQVYASSTLPSIRKNFRRRLRF